MSKTLFIFFLFMAAIGVAQEKVALKTFHGTYVCAEPAHRISTRATAIGPWEIFTIVRKEDGSVIINSWQGASLRSANLFVLIPLPCIHGSLGSMLPVLCWDRFEIVDCGGGYVAFKSTLSSYGYLTALPGPTYALMGHVKKLDIWEKFQIIKNPVPVRNAAADQEELETIQYDKNKDSEIVAFFEKAANVGRENDAAALVAILPPKSLKETADEIRGRIKIESQKVALEKMGIHEEDMKLEDKALLTKYLTATMKMAQSEAGADAKGKLEIAVLATKVDGDTAFAKVKYTRGGESMETEHILVKEDGVWVLDEDFSVADKTATDKDDKNKDDEDKDDEDKND